MCQLLFHLNKNWNINKFYKLPNKKKIPWKSVQGLEFLYTDTYRQTGILKLRDILSQKFITNMSKKLIGSFLKIYINNFIHNVLIKTINNDTSKQYVETTVLVHAFTAFGNTLINSQPSCQEVLRFVLQLHQ